MKTFIKTAIVACMALAVGLVGCQNEPGVDGPKEGVKNVAIKIARGTRAVAAPLDGDTEAVNFAGGALYFAADGDVVKFVEILAAGEDVTDEANQVSITALEAVNGKTFFNLPVSIDAVHFVANLEEYDFATIEDLEDVALYLEDLADTDEIAIYGFDTALAPGVDAEENEVLVAEIKARPVAARFEFDYPVALGEDDENLENPFVVDFDVVAIYLDNIHLGVLLDGTATGDAFGGEIVATQENPVDNDDYLYPALDDEATEEVDGWHFLGLSYDTEVPVEGTVWSYNLPAPGTGTYVAATTEDPAQWGFTGDATLPYVIVELTNIVLSNGIEVDGNKFLTFIPNDDEVDLEQGKVYKVNEPAFNFSDLTDWPYQGAININVQVEIMPWTAEPVDYDFN